MITLADFNKTDNFDHVMAAHINDLIASSLRSEYKNIETLSATRDLLDADTPIQLFDCNGADRTARLPSPNTTTNHPFLIKNETAIGHYNITLTNSGGSNTLCVIPPGEYAFVLADGSGVWTVINRMFNRPLTTGQITSNQNDWYPGAADYSDVIRTYSDADRNITGFGFPAQGKTFLLVNTGSYTITLKNESSSSVAANRLAMGADVKLGSGKSVMFHYDGGSSRWRLVGGVTALETQYKITPTVSSNDLILTITHADGTTPSTDRPLWFLINNTWRACTAALSVTKADGTNWANLGGAELGTQSVDLFAYVVWNTNLSPDAVDVLWARVPYGRVYSDFSSTTTNQLYAAINATAPAATDDVALIGRFAATLSLSGTSHLWTVPTYTNDTLIQHPIDETRWLTWAPVYTGFSSAPTGNNTYKVIKDNTFIHRDVSTNGTSNATTFTMTFPFNFSVAGAIYSWVAITDNGATSSTPGHLQAVTANSNVGSLYKTFYQGAWTGSGAKNAYLLDFNYRIR